MREKQFILSEIKRIAARNGGKPVGIDKFKTETGIAEHEWSGVHWARWSDALMEAGFEPLKWTTGSSVEEIIEEIVKLIRKHGRYPTNSEVLLDKRNNEAIPTPKAILGRLGERAEAIQKIRNYCSSREGYADVSAFLAQDDIDEDSENGVTESKSGAGRIKFSGHVYLVKSGKRYKIGQTANRWQRMNQLDKQTSEGLDEVIHTIAAIDDAPGIERYWHERFKEKRQHGEWFDLSTEDISAFKKRKFM
jgi:hypothetical protein